MAQASAKVFEYVILFHPTDDGRKKGERCTILAGPKAVVAMGIEQARTEASLAIPESHRDKLDRIEVAVRPF